MLAYIKLLLLWMAGLGFIGFLRSKLGNKVNSALVNIGDKTRQWLSEDTFTARVSLFFLPLLALYNFMAWALFGLQSILDSILWVLNFIWWLLNWCWNEVLHPTVFALARLVWHYLVRSSWKLFEHSFVPVRSSVAKDNIVPAIYILLRLTLLLAAGLAVFQLADQLFLIFPALLLAFFLIQQALFRLLQLVEPQKFTAANAQMATKLTALWLAVAAIAAGALSLVWYFQASDIAAGLGVTVTQAGITAAVLTGSAFLSATTCLPAHLHESGGSTTVISYLKTLLWRLPKLTFGQIFLIPGLMVVSIIPVALAMVMSLALDKVTGKDTLGWVSEVSAMNTILPSIGANMDSITRQEEDSVRLEAEKAKAVAEHNQKIQTTQNTLKQNKQLLAAIKDRQIHTMTETPMVGDTQFFSVPGLPSCGIYDWQVKDSAGKILSEERNSPRIGSSSIFYYTWIQDGEYTINLIPKNNCGDGEPITRKVVVSKRSESSFSIAKPSGNTQVCTSDELPYAAQGGFGLYEWQVPQDASIIGSSNQSRIMVKFGQQSGTVRVRAATAEGKYSLWVGLNVRVMPLPGRNESQPDYKGDEVSNDRARTFAFVFQTREIGKDSVAAVQSRLNRQEAAKRATLAYFAGMIHETQVRIDLHQLDIRMLLYRMIGDLLALAGLALLFSLTFAAPLLYFVQYHFSLYGFAQSGKHYWEELLEGIRARNPQQPLLGIFALVVIGVLSWFIKLPNIPFPPIE